jgi:integral membrane protein (TIGR00529 family)
MDGFIKLAIVFIGIVIALKKKVFVGYVLFAAGLLTAVLFEASPVDIVNGYKDVLFSVRFLNLLGIIILITFLGRLLRDIGSLDRLVSATKDLIGGARVASALMPLLVGMMPMPGGALMSAPLVGKILSKDKYSREFVTVVNYWSRHVIEFAWPIYPGVVLAAGLASIPVGKISLLMLPMPFIMLLIGFLFFIRKINNGNDNRGQFIRPLIGILHTVWPILLAIAIYAVFSISLLFSVAIVLILLIAIERPSLKILGDVAREAFSPRLFALVFGIISFQQMLEITDAIDSVTALSTELGLPSIAIIVAVAFTAGILTGMLAALIGLSFTILAGYLYQPELNLGNIFIAFLAGYVGMILSPTHFCLILTNEYFRANLGSVYRLLAVPIIILFLVGFLLYVLGYPWQILA